MFCRVLRALPAALILFAVPSQAQFGQSAKVPVTLVSESTVVEAGQPFTVALRLQHPPGVHTYWINPGIGQATKIDWKLPDGWKAGPIVWPIPKLYDNGAGPSHTYEGDTFLLTELTPPTSFSAGSRATIGGRATWFECTEENCVRISDDVTLTVTAGSSAEPAPAMRAAFDAVRAAQPRTTDSWNVVTDATAEAVTITLTPQTGATEDPGAVYFFESANTVELGPPAVEKKDGALVVRVVRKKPDQTPAGFLYAPNGWLADGSLPALALTFAATGTAAAETPTTGTAAPTAAEEPTANASVDGKAALAPGTLAAMAEIIPASGPKFVDLSGSARRELGFWWALVLAAAGGLILNAMPCVFPVLGLKVLGFVQQAGEDAGKVRLHGLVFTLGLLVTMWLLAGVLILLNATGERLGWGFQQQSPGFLAFIIALLFLLGLNLAGVFEWGAGMVGVGGGLMDKQGLAGSFFTGALTTLVATPCSGPFLGAAMGFALKQTAPLSLVLFTSFGLGIALPYLVLSLFPKLVHYLPRPGAWMETFKIAMAFPMLATVVYFLHAFGAQTGRSGVSWMLLALLLLALAAWIYGRWSAPHRSAAARRGGLIAAALTIAAAVWTARDAVAAVPESRLAEERITRLSEQLEHAIETGGSLPPDTTSPGPGGLTWEKWSPERVAALRRERKIIFVDFTADWCATCQVNKRVVFKSPGSEAVTAAFGRLGVVALKADWTNEDPVISEFLFRNGLFAIPVNFVYPADPGRPPIMLPEGFLTQGNVLEGLEKAR
jgi:thiol:disulfide interchange protein